MRLNSLALKRHAAELGFNVVGLTPARPAPHLHAYEQWLAANYHGTLDYLARPDRVIRRRDLNHILPGARTLIMVGVDYATAPSPELTNPTRGRIASYAWGDDYHTLLLPRLKDLARFAHPTAQWRAYVDTGAIIERDHAQQAGLGFVGKNTLLIHPRRGSYFFLGEIITEAEFDEYDQPSTGIGCGGCTRCLAACPTDAFPRPYTLDARRCISYLTIEYKGWIDPELRPAMGNWVFGCDVCQAVCPWNRFAMYTQEAALLPPNLARMAPPLRQLLMLDEADFEALYTTTPLKRTGRVCLVRNACIAAGNSGDPSFVPDLLPLLHDAHPLVRGHAAWALVRLRETATVQAALAIETDVEAQNDMVRSLQPVNTT